MILTFTWYSFALAVAFVQRSSYAALPVIVLLQGAYLNIAENKLIDMAVHTIRRDVLGRASFLKSHLSGMPFAYIQGVARFLIVVAAAVIISGW